MVLLPCRDCGQPVPTRPGSRRRCDACRSRRPLIAVPCAYCGRPVPSLRAVRRCCKTCRRQRHRETLRRRYARLRAAIDASPKRTRQQRDARLAESFVPSPPPSPTHGPPGSRQRLAAFATRFKAGQELFDPRDAADWEGTPAGDHLAAILAKVRELRDQRKSRVKSGASRAG